MLKQDGTSNVLLQGSSDKNNKCNEKSVHASKKYEMFMKTALTDDSILTDLENLGGLPPEVWTYYKITSTYSWQTLGKIQFLKIFPKN